MASGKKAAAAGRKSSPRRDANPAKDPARRGRAGSRDGRRKGRAGGPKPRSGRPGRASSKAGAAKFRNAAFAAVDANLPPWALRHRHAGRPGINPRALAKCILLMNEEQRTCRGMADYLNDHPALLKNMGLNKAPSKSTLNRAMRKITPRYLRRVGRAAAAASAVRTSRSRAAA